MGNFIGQFTAIFGMNSAEANKVTFMIPGPNYSDQRHRELGAPPAHEFFNKLAPPGALYGTRNSDAFDVGRLKCHTAKRGGVR